MALWQVKKGYWCCSDVNLVAAMMVENYIIKDGVIDDTDALPPVDLAFAYIELVPRKIPKKRRRGSSGKSRITYEGPEDVRRRELREWKPVIMFALAPYEHSHRLANAKKDLWFNGTLFSPPVYGVQHHALMRVVEQLRQEFERKTGRPTTLKNKAFAVNMIDGIARLATERSELSAEAKEIPSVAVRGEEARIGARGIIHK